MWTNIGIRGEELEDIGSDDLVRLFWLRLGIFWTQGMSCSCSLIGVELLGDKLSGDKLTQCRCIT